VVVPFGNGPLVDFVVVDGWLRHGNKRDRVVLVRVVVDELEIERIIKKNCKVYENKMFLSIFQ
jgi:hypothetical protein